MQESQNSVSPQVTLFWYDGGMKLPAKLAANVELPSRDGGIVFVGDKGSILARLNGHPQFVDPDQNDEYHPPQPFLPLSTAEVDGIVDLVRRRTGLAAEAFYGPG